MTSLLISRHQSHGLTFACDFNLPELLRASDDQPPHVVIQVGDYISSEVVRSAGSPNFVLENVIDFQVGESSLFFSEVGRFTVTQGRHILIEPLQGTNPSTWRLPLLGSILALLLEQRGLFVLHAGAVDMGGFAAAFLGEKGQGKSTLNAALASAGYPLFADDVVALTWPDDKQPYPLTLCGFAQIKLVPDAVRGVLQSEPGTLPAVAPELAEVDKRSFMAPLAVRPAPLRHLFVLSSLPDEIQDEVQDEGFQLRALTPQEALLQIMPHTFGARFGEMYLKDERKKAHFRQCARVVNECQVWELARRRDLALLPATIAAIARAVGASPPQSARPS